MTPTTAQEKVTAAQEVAQSGVIHEVLDRADGVLEHLLARYVQGTLSDRDAAVGVATIAELRRTATKAQRTVAQGVAADSVLNPTRKS